MDNKIKLTKNRNNDVILRQHIYNYKNISSLSIILGAFEKFKVKNSNFMNDYKFLKSKFLLSYYSIREDKYTNLKTPYIKKNECREFLDKIEKIEKKKNNLQINEFAKNIMFIKSN